MSTTTLKSHVYERLRQMLARGDYAPGARLSDAAVAKELGVSRAPVREAISRLETEGLVEQFPHVGVFVRGCGAKELEETLDLRCILESYAAERAATRLTQAQLDRLSELLGVLREESRRVRQILRELVRAGQGGVLADPPRDHLVRGGSADAEFHRIILAAADNARVSKVLEDTRLLAELASPDRRVPPLLTLSNVARPLLEHHRLLRALRRRDARLARDLMRTHIENLKRKLLDRIEGLDPKIQMGSTSLRAQLARGRMD